MISETNQKADIVIVGGGMIGAALASGLTQQGFQVVVLEQEVPPKFDLASQPDIRISAIGAASVTLLRHLDVWPAVTAMRCAPYRQLKTWEWQIAQVSFDAQSLGLSELGYMVENSVLQHALWQRLQEQQVKMLCPVCLCDMHSEKNGWKLTLNNGETLHARLVIGADGTKSQVRQLAGIGIHRWSYDQSCMLITVHCEQDPGDTTWQQFTPAGPRAFLPLFDRWASLVWYDSPSRIRQLKAMPILQLQKEILAHFPPILGMATPVATRVFPLVSCHATQYVLPSLALVGDAAHTINPLGGQGVNLGYRDVNALIDVLSTSRLCGENWASRHVLDRYQRIRKKDNLLMQTGMDLFYFVFSNPSLKIIRNLGLISADRSGVLKRLVLRYALGL